MIGWFIAAESGECDCCGHRTARGERVYHDGGEMDERRLCVECAP